jgi:hypothetical protein
MTRVDATVDRFDQDGLVVLDERLPSSIVDRLREIACTSLSASLARVEACTSGPLGLGMDEGFAEIVQRAPGRFDVVLEARELTMSGVPVEDAPWSAAVEGILGPEARLLYRGVLMARPGAAEQPWHADGEHLFPGFPVHLPTHCLNVFVPLVDLTVDNGATELCPGSHRQTGTVVDPSRQDDDLPARIGYRGSSLTPLLAAGSVMLFDYRLVHRGLANRDLQMRPVFYLTYARPWFCDVRSFPERRLATDGATTPP